jgi:tRNA (cmo5U34)-methyltransferase
MLGQAQELLGDRIQAVVGDLNDPLPEGPFDAVISALAIHHLTDDDKQSLFARSLEALSPGGIFINAEQVAGPTPSLEATYMEWHHETASALGTTSEQWSAALERFEHDHHRPVGDQLRWLTDSGFQDVDCLMKEYRFAVLCGRRPGSA